MEGSSPRTALEELLRRGMRNTRGLDELTPQAVAAAGGDLRGGTGWTARCRRCGGCWTRRWMPSARALFPDPSDDARFAEAQLDALPPGTAAAVGELAEYDWRSAKRQGELPGDPRPARPGTAGVPVPGHETGAAEHHTRGRRAGQADDVRPERPARRARPGRGHRRSSSPSSWTGTASSSRRIPRNTDELIDALAARAAAAQRMMNSMTDAAAGRTGRV